MADEGVPNVLLQWSVQGTLGQDFDVALEMGQLAGTHNATGDPWQVG